MGFLCWIFSSRSKRWGQVTKCPHTTCWFGAVVKSSNIPKTKLSAHNFGIFVVPLVITDRAPPFSVEHLHSTFKVLLSSNQTQRRTTAYKTKVVYPPKNIFKGKFDDFNKMEVFYNNSTRQNLKDKSHWPSGGLQTTAASFPWLQSPVTNVRLRHLLRLLSSPRQPNRS